MERHDGCDIQAGRDDIHKGVLRLHDGHRHTDDDAHHYSSLPPARNPPVAQNGSHTPMDEHREDQRPEGLRYSEQSGRGRRE